MKEFIKFILTDMSVVLKVETEIPRLQYFCNLYSNSLLIITKFYKNQNNFIDELIEYFREYQKTLSIQKINKIIKSVDDLIKKIDNKKIAL
jgi:hypothetical protein